MPAIKLMCEYVVQYPLWWESGGQIAAGEVPLSPKLDGDLTAWAADFNAHYDDEHGWPSEKQMRAHMETGERLAERVNAELSGAHTVRFRNWATNHRPG